MKPIEDKNFLNFLGKPLIQHQLEMLSRNDFGEIVLVGGAHNLEKLGKLVEELSLNVQLIEQKDLEMGMCGAVISAKELISGGPLLIFSSNDVVDDEAFSVMAKAFESGVADSYLLGKKVEEYFPGGYLETDEGGLIKSIVEKPEPGTEPSDLVNLVVHLHGDGGKLVGYLENAASERDDLYEVALDKMMKEGVKFKAVSYDGFWQPIKFPWHVHNVFKYFFAKAEKKVSDSAQISEHAIIKGDVIIGENVKIFENAVVNGPVYLGDNSIVATNALVRDSHLGEGCIVGFNTEVARSYLGSDVWTHSNYVGDSVIGNNVSFGAGTVTGNLRLDEGNIMVSHEEGKLDTKNNKFGLITGDDIRVGINTSFMPGIKIGGNSFIGAGIVVAQDIPENSFVRGSFELKISENKGKVDRESREEMKNKLTKKQ